MDIRSVQKTGDMRYVYLPTKWCKEQKINSNSKVTIEQQNDGSLLVIPKIREKKPKHLKLHIDEDDLDVIQKLIVACYINPAESFTIDTRKKLNLITMLHNEGLTSLEAVEMDKNKIICESVPTVSDPQSLLRTSIRKIKNMIAIMMKNYHPELIARYENEIDRNRLLISKSVVSALTYHTVSRLKTIDLYYIELVSTYLEGMADHLIGIEKTEKEFLDSVRDAVDALQDIFDNLKELDYEKAIVFLKKVKLIRNNEVKNVETYRKRRIKKYLINVSEVMLDWAITKEIEG
jgi:phosphate uptake regulator